MRIRPRSLACLAGLALALPAGAAAQRGVPALRMGDSVRVTISAADPALEEWGSYKVFRFNAEPDRAYRFTARTDSGMVALRVARLAGVLTEYLNGTGIHRHVQLRFRPPAPGPYLIVIASTTGGAFTLQGQELVSGPAVPRTLPLGERVQGELSVASGTFPEGRDAFYDLYTFSASRDQKLHLFYTGSQSVSVGRLVDGRFVTLSAGGAVQRAGAVEIPEDGEYAVRVAGTLGEDEAVPYALRLVDLRMRPEPRRLEVGRAAEGVFDPATAFPVNDHEMVDEWVLHGSAGQRLRIALSSTVFDTYLIVGRMQGGRFEVLDDDDDGGGGTDSRLDLTLSADGDYLVRVQPYGSVREDGGPYTLQATLSARADPAQNPRRTRPETRPVRWGAPMQGTLDEIDVLLEDGSPYDVWTFSATAGQRITITLRSEDFDAYLAVGRDEDGEWMELTSNDDVVGQNGRDARVVMVAPDTGEYSIRANTFPLQPTGAYVLTVERER
jgi:hypothetical protein